MAIHEQLSRIHKIELQWGGWAKETELAKVASRDGQRFDCAIWLHKFRELTEEKFKREVSKDLIRKNLNLGNSLFHDLHEPVYWNRADTT